MPQRIEVEGLGLLEFPDGMSDDEISSAIDREYAATRQLQPGDLMGEAARQIPSIADTTGTRIAPTPDFEPLEEPMPIAPSGGGGIRFEGVSEAPETIGGQLADIPRRIAQVPHALATGAEYAAAAAMNIPAAIYRQATMPTEPGFVPSPQQTRITPTEITSAPVPLPFQAGRPVAEFERTVMSPEGNDLTRLVEGLLTPGMLASFPFAAAKPVQIAFLASTVPGAIDAATRLVSSDTPPEERRSAATDFLVNSVMSYGIGKHLIGKPRPTTDQRIGVTDASEIPSPTGVLEPEIRPQVGEGAPIRQPGEVALETGRGPEAQVVSAVEPPKEVISPSSASGETAAAPQALVGPEPLPAPGKTVERPVIVGAFRRGSTIRLEVDASKSPVTAEQIKAAFEGPDRSVEVTAFEPNEFSTAQGRANFRIDIGTPEGPYSDVLAKKAFEEIFGTSKDISEKSAIERAMPSFEQRFSKSIRKSQEAAPPASPTPAPPINPPPIESKLIVAPTETKAPREPWEIVSTLPRKKVALSGEYSGMTGTVESLVQKRYSKEPDMVRVQVDGFPKPGGWSGKVTVDAKTLSWPSAESERTQFTSAGTPAESQQQAKAITSESVGPSAATSNLESPTPPPAPGLEGREAKAQLAADWTSATEDVPTPKAEPTPPPKPPSEPPNIAEMHAGIPLPKFAHRKLSPLDKVTASHSGKVQKSFSEARRALSDIKKEVPSDRRQAAISIWREAGGDIPTLQSWTAAAKGKAFKQAALDAQNLTPKEIAVANKVIAAFDVLHARGTTFDVLKSHRDNYVPHVWDVQRPGTGFGTGMLKQRFKFSKARTFNTFFEGDQAGFKPKTLAIGKLLPAYIHEMNRVIADRQFVRDIATELASDGRPLVLPRGNARQLTDAAGDVTHLVFPRGFKEAKDAAGKPIDQHDYRTMEGQPALHDWRWVDKDADGNPIFMQSDLALHPEAYRRLNAMIGQSALRQWYHEPVTGTAQVPRAVIRGLDTAQAAMKREMFGLLAPFHQVQEGTHAVGHLVNPFFGLEKVDLKNPKQLDAANHGLMMLPDRASARSYLEGVGTQSSLISRGIRKGGPVGRALSDVIDGYQDYLFHQYIPALKYKTYEAMVGRNTKLYAKELASGEMTMADVKVTSAEQANAAYGHLNYALLDRNPTIQHIIQLGALAPDFLEARARFAGQAVKGLSSKVGHEQMKAIAILAAAQAGTALILSNLLGVPYDEKHPFEVVYKGRRYAMRSVPEDIYGLLKDTRQFAYGRVNPLIVKGGVQLATGMNYRGEKTDALDTVTELMAGYIPITARSIPAVRSLTESGRNTPISPLQQLAGSLGLRVSRFSPISETYKLASDWSKTQKIERDTGSYPVSKYQQLRYALEDADPERAKSEYAELLKTLTPGKIATGFRESINHPFTGSKANDAKFSESLKGYDRELYRHALRTRKSITDQFNATFGGGGKPQRLQPIRRQMPAQK